MRSAGKGGDKRLKTRKIFNNSIVNIKNQLNIIQSPTSQSFQPCAVVVADSNSVFVKKVVVVVIVIIQGAVN